MHITLNILRRESADNPSFWEQFSIDTDSSGTVMTALMELNGRLSAEGKRPVRYECSCLQKKCGACAMVINGKRVSPVMRSSPTYRNTELSMSNRCGNFRSSPTSL